MLIQLTKQYFQLVWQFLTSKTAKRFYWVTVAGFLGLITEQFTNSSWWLAPFIVAAIASLTKEINNKFTK